ncbi:MAG: GNAT family N-acetyltransferase [Chloroflexi bacterium RBG_13_57_8]|nr:MAG: GNAT family N-acetyltransferase [Chloroflexi bacterium RBG_13_57_8]
MAIRPATPDDLRAITDIYNQAILNTTSTFDTNPKTLKQQKAWFSRHDPAHPVLVALESDRVVGWASLSPWSERRAYAGTAEISMYIREGHRGQGIGRELTLAILKAGRKAGLHMVISCITEGNAASLHLGKELGFRRIGVIKEAGSKFGRLLDVYLNQIFLDPPAD